MKYFNAVSTGRVSKVRRRARGAIPLRTAIRGPNVPEESIGRGRARKSEEEQMEELASVLRVLDDEFNEKEQLSQVR